MSKRQYLRASIAALAFKDIMATDKIKDRAQRHSEFTRLFALLPGPTRADRARQATAAMLLSGSKHVRKYMMSTPARVPTWQGLELLAMASGAVVQKG